AHPHGKAQMNGSAHEVWGKNGRMPSRHNRHGKVPGNDAVDLDHQRSSQSGKEEIGTAVVTPLPVCSLPSLSEKAVDLLPPSIRLIPHNRKIRNKSGEKEDGGHDEGCAH